MVERTILIYSFMISCIEIPNQLHRLREETKNVGTIDLKISEKF